MKKILFTLIAMVSFVFVKAQTKDAVTISYGDSTVVEQFPSFPGGLSEFYRYLGKTIRYPATAREHNTQGKVIISVMIEKDGSVSNAKVVRSVSKDLDDEALRVINLSPKWIPGTQNGKTARMAFSIPINFTITTK
jgi:protein TonB